MVRDPTLGFWLVGSFSLTSDEDSGIACDWDRIRVVLLQALKPAAPLELPLLPVTLLLLVCHGSALAPSMKSRWRKGSRLTKR